jgi:crossover junction endodeoxyribonuclease RusA
MQIEFYLPFPPSVNHYYVKTRNGVFIGKKGKEYRKQAAEALNQQVPGLAFDSDDKLMVEVVLFMPDKRTRDLDNYNKCLLDALTQAGLFYDDSQIDQLFIYRGALLKSGQVFVRIGHAGPTIPVGATP